MEVTDLKYFVKIAQGMKIEEVAALYHITASSVSKSLKRLETELGVELMDRSRRSLSLTLGGQHFLRKLLPLADQFEDMMDSMEQFSDNNPCVLRICAIPSFYALNLLWPIYEFRVKNPTIYMSMTDNRSYNQNETYKHYEYLDLLRNDSVDLIFLHRPICNAADLDAIELYRDYIVAVTKNEHAFSTQDVVTVEDLQKESVCLSHSLEDYHELLAPLKKEKAQRLHSNDMIFELFTKRCDVCLYLASELPLLLSTHMPGFTVRRIANAEEIPVMMWVRREELRTNGLDKFIEFVAENKPVNFIRDKTQWENIMY